MARRLRLTPSYSGVDEWAVLHSYIFLHFCIADYFRPVGVTTVPIEEVPQLASINSYDLRTAPVEGGVPYLVTLIATNKNGNSNESEAKPYEQRPGKS